MTVPAPADPRVRAALDALAVALAKLIAHDLERESQLREVLENQTLETTPPRGPAKVRGEVTDLECVNTTTRPL